ncbi:MAG: hypothetical protein JNN07_16540 [Verrucomicrobiales bacterium]|nr:hypothetical protein [Verrucomicrobiales bacterium]
MNEVAKTGLHSMDAEAMIQSFRELKLRTCKRPTSVEEIRLIEQELEQALFRYYQERERTRATLPLESEHLVYHRTLHSLRSAISQAMRDHEVARMGVERVRLMVRRGQMERAERLSENLKPLLVFEDLTPYTFEEVLRERELRQLKTFGIMIGSIVSVLVILAVLESMGIFEGASK